MTKREEQQLRSLRLRLQSCDDFEPIDAHVGSLCAEGSRDPDHLEEMFFVGAAVSRALRAGHPCVLLSELAETKVSPGDHHETGEEHALLFAFSLVDELRQRVQRSSAVSTCSLSLDEESVPSTPLVFDGHDRIYATRFFEHERRLAHALSRLVSRAGSGTEDDTWIESRLDHYFPQPIEPGTRDRQREAAQAALQHRLCVVSGGPGTGKTSTVVKILVLLCEVAERAGRALPRILLMAPTGKAAARLNESIERALFAMNLAPTLASALTPRAMTIHRALGVRFDSSTRYLRSSDYPFSADVVLIDECSMVDLSLMRHVCEALSADARLVLLGDRHQLASVEAGSVFSELCHALGSGGEAGLSELTYSYRFGPDSGIAALSTLIRDGQTERLDHFLKQSHSDVSFHPAISEERGLGKLLALALSKWERAFSAPDAASAFSELSKFRILAAHRKGLFGVEQLNQMVAHMLVERGKIPSANQLSRGQLLMIVENDPTMGLNNGDIAIVWPDASGRLMACFATEGHKMRQIAPGQLPAHELCFAMTIHKSQGSEYDSVALVLPPETSPILSRELAYTGVTRAKGAVSVFSDRAALVRATNHSIVRRSGLGQALAERLNSPP